MAKLDCAEQNKRQQDILHASQDRLGDQQDTNFTSLRPSKDTTLKRACDDSLTDSILEALEDEPFEDLPATQCEFQEHILENTKRHKHDGEKTSTPLRDTEKLAKADIESGILHKTKRNCDMPKARRSVTDQLKRTMLCNAAAPSSVSRTVVLKEAVVSEEISVAIQAIETISSETPDLGPFFGLPSKVKDLVYQLKGIKNLYGDTLF